MSWKLIGTLLLLLAGSLLVWSYLQRKNRERECVAELIWDLEHIATEIRWQHRRFPDILEGLSQRPYFGADFANIVKGLSEHKPLQLLWYNEFSACLPEISDVMTQMDLSGDEQQMTDTMLYAARKLKHLQNEKKQKKKEGEKLFIAMVGTGIGLLIILLM